MARISGQVIDEHPILGETLLFAGTALIIPEDWLLRQVLSLFGFGPSSPVKGVVDRWFSIYLMRYVSSRIYCCLGAKQVLGRCCW